MGAASSEKQPEDCLWVGGTDKVGGLQKQLMQSLWEERGCFCCCSSFFLKHQALLSLTVNLQPSSKAEGGHKEV